MAPPTVSAYERKNGMQEPRIREHADVQIVEPPDDAYLLFLGEGRVVDVLHSVRTQRVVHRDTDALEPLRHSSSPGTKAFDLPIDTSR
jgi:hypothetical protein